MKTYSYSKASQKGKRLLSLLKVGYNEGTLNEETEGQLFTDDSVPVVMQCRASRFQLQVPSNLSGIQRPSVHVEGVVESAWGTFPDGVMALDFSNGQYLPMSYVQALDDDTIKMLIDAGMYKTLHFDELMSKVLKDESFEVDATMDVSYLTKGLFSEGQEKVPVFFAEPVHSVNEQEEPTENSTVLHVVQTASALVIALRKDGVETDALLRDEEAPEQVFFDVNEEHINESLTKTTEEVEQEGFKVTSDLLGAEIDMTSAFVNNLDLGSTSEDAKIVALKYGSPVKPALDEGFGLVDDEDEKDDDLSL